MKGGVVGVRGGEGEGGRSKPKKVTDSFTFVSLAGRNDKERRGWEREVVQMLP